MTQTPPEVSTAPVAASPRRGGEVRVIVISLIGIVLGLSALSLLMLPLLSRPGNDPTPPPENANQPSTPAGRVALLNELRAKQLETLQTAGPGEGPQNRRIPLSAARAAVIADYQRAAAAPARKRAP